jgi:hypothetical protein
MDWGTIGRMLLIFGAIFVVLGLIFLLIGRVPWLGKLPGDIFIRRGDSSFYFPLVTCIVISVIVTTLVNVVIWLLNK